MSVLDLLGLNRIFKGGTEVKPTRKILNFIGDGVTITDNPGQKRTDITFAGGGGGGEGTITGPGTATPGHVTVWGADETEIADGGVALADLATDADVATAVDGLASEAWVTDAIEDAELAAESGIVVAVYSGHGNKSISNLATTWTDIHVAANNGWVDDLTINTSRSGSEVTVTRAGVYLVNFSMSWFGSGCFVNLRVRVNGTTKLGNSTYGGTLGSVNPSVFINGPISLQAGDVVRFQYCNSASGSAGYTQSADVNGESNLWIAAVHLTRVAGNTLSDDPDGISISEDGRITGVSAPSADSDADTKGARNAAIAAGPGAWKNYADFNFTQMSAQSFPTAGDVTINGITFQAGNVGTGAQSMAIEAGSGLVFRATSTTNTYWYGSGHAAAYLGIDLDRLPNFLLDASEVRIFAEMYLTVGTANYATACFGIGKRLNFTSADFSPMIRQYYENGSVIRSVFMPFGTGEEQRTMLSTHNVGMIHFKSGHEHIGWYSKIWAGADSAPNSSVFDDLSSFLLQSRRVEAIAASAAPRLVNADKPMAMVCGQNGNTVGNTVSTFKRMRIQYR